MNPVDGEQRSEPRAQLPRSPIQAIDRAVGILAVLSEAGPNGLSLQELSAAVGLRSTTAHSLLSALLTHGLVGQDAPTRRYRLGGRFLELNRVYLDRADLASIAAATLSNLWKETTETVHFSVLEGGYRVDLTVLVSPQVLSVIPTNGQHESRSAHLHRTAAGKVLLAGLPDDRLEAYIAGCDLSQLTPTTITNKKRIRREIDTVRSQGFATNNEEEARGVLGVAAPVRDANGGIVAAVCIGYPSARSSQEYDEPLRTHVIDAAERISILLGAADRAESSGR